MTCRIRLSHIAKAQPAVAPKASTLSANPATIAGVPTFNISTPRAPDASAAKADEEPIMEIKSPGVLAQEAKARLDELLQGGSTSLFHGLWHQLGFRHVLPTESPALNSIPGWLLVDRSNRKIGLLCILTRFIFKNIPSRRFPYVRFAQFHHHQVHLKLISCGRH